MNAQKFVSAYNAGRNGVNYFVTQLIRITPGRVPFQYSDGVEQCALAGCFWLIDVIATECCNPLRASGEPTSIVKVKVEGSSALITLTIADDKPPIWSREVEYTNMPEGIWNFELADEGERFALILLSEH